MAVAALLAENVSVTESVPFTVASGEAEKATGITVLRSPKPSNVFWSNTSYSKVRSKLVGFSETPVTTDDLRRNVLLADE